MASPRVYYPEAMLEILVVDVDGVDYALNVRPISVTWTSNSIRRADTFTASFDGLALPFDPRLLSDAIVTIYFGERRDLVGEAIDPTNILDVVFIGMVDEVRTQRAGDQAAKIDVSGRDYTGLLLDRKVPKEEYNGDAVGKRYNLDRTLADVVLEILRDAVGRSGNVAIVNRFIRYADDVGPDHPLWQNVARRTSLQVPWLVAEQGEDAWSLLSRICDLIAALPFFELDLLRVEYFEAIRRPPVKLWEHALARVDVSRNLDASLGRPVVVRTYDPFAEDDSKAVREFRYPPNPDALLGGSPDGWSAPKAEKHKRSKNAAAPEGPIATTATDNAAVFFLPQGTHPETMKDVARWYYQLARAFDVRGECELVDLRVPTFEGVVEAGARRIWTLRNSDTIQLDLIDTPRLAELVAGRARLEDTLAYFGQSRENAASLRDFYGARLLNLPEDFYVDEATHSFDASDGYTCSLRFSSAISAEV